MLLFSLNTKLAEIEFGGKAAGLSGIQMAGLAIPPGFAVHKKALSHYLSQGEIAGSLVRELQEILPDIPGEQVIVRSSAIGEDADDYSFAGQFDSFAVKKEINLVTDAIKMCWDGLNNDRAKSYQAISGKVLSEMGVVVQQYISADFSGVLFTKSPGNPEQIYAEYISGGAEPLVSGKVTPQSFSADQQGNLLAGDLVPFNHLTLVRNALTLKKSFGKDLDIEWLHANNQFWFVQARPIREREQTKVYWTSTNLNENYPSPVSPLLASIARVSYYHYFKNLARLLQLNESSVRELEFDLSNSVGFFGNRIYYNMTGIHNVIAASPYHSYFKDAFNNFVGYRNQDTSSREFTKKSSILRLVARLIFLNLTLASHVRIIENKVISYTGKVCRARTLKEYSLNFSGFLDLRFNQWYHASLADLFSMIHYKILGSITQHVYGRDHKGVHNSFIQAIPGLVSNEPLNASWLILEEIGKIPGGKNYFISTDPAQVLTHIGVATEWQTVKKAFDNYLDTWGFRCSGELMLTLDNYSDDPAKYVELLQTYLRSNQGDPQKTVEAMDSERKQMMAGAIRKIFRKRHVLFPLAAVEAGILVLSAKLCRKAIFFREKVRYHQARMYHGFKVTINQIGREFVSAGIVESPSDILFLNYPEIGSLLSSSDIYSRNYREIITIRRKIYEKQSALSYPVSFETRFGQSPDLTLEADNNLQPGKEFFGLPASGGKIRARAKVLKTVLEIGKLQKGEILVTRQTDPGWAMAFPVIGGLIVEHGGALSHGAIVAREFGIPAVLGIEKIADIIKDNDLIMLDGDLGKVQILS
jgi:pyruvate,water dikinase